MRRVRQVELELPQHAFVPHQIAHKGESALAAAREKSRTGNGVVSAATMCDKHYEGQVLQHPSWAPEAILSAGNMACRQCHSAGAAPKVEQLDELVAEGGRH